MSTKNDSSDLQPKIHDHGQDEDEESSGMVWNNDWDDNDSTLGDRALESQHILGYPDGRGGVIDEDEEAIEDEIRANLSSKITSSLHAYKIAGIALIITLISFTINTVFPPTPTIAINDVRNLRSMCRNDYAGRSLTACFIYITHHGP
jgi:hypothetical protein